MRPPLLFLAFLFLASTGVAREATEICGMTTEITSPSLPDGRQRLSYCLHNGVELAEGDIQLPPADRAGTEGAQYGGFVNRTSELWPDGTVPYSIDPELSNSRRVSDAIEHWETRTSIRFRSRGSDTDYVRFVPGDNCSSSIGRVGGVQYVTLADGCDRTAVTHEIGHALGLWHEQSRNDRDQYVTVLWENIADIHKFNFNKFGSEGYVFGTYDMRSIMHYNAYAFSKNGRPTMVLKDGQTAIPSNGRALSEGDVATIHHLYGKGSPKGGR